MGIEPFNCSATQTLNGSCILGVVVGDSLEPIFGAVRVCLETLDYSTPVMELHLKPSVHRKTEVILLPL